MIKATGNLEFIVLNVECNILHYEYWKSRRLIANYNFDILENKDSRLFFTTIFIF